MAESPVGSSALRRWAPCLVTVLIGVALTLMAFIALQKKEQAALRDDFEKAAEERISLLDQEIQSCLLYLESLGAFIRTDERVDRPEFGMFVRPFLSQHPGVRAFRWVPRVLHSQRERYEAAGRAEGIAGFQISERTPDGTTVRAADRDEYFPLHFFESGEGDEPVLGFDLASEPVRFETLSLARDTGGMRATGRLRLVKDPECRFGLLVFLPIYERGAPVDSVEERRRHIGGFVLAVFDLTTLVEKTLSHVEPEGIDVCVFDASAATDDNVLYRCGDCRTDHPARLDRARDDAIPVHSATLDVAGRQWVVRVLASPEYVAARTGILPWVVLGGGLICTVLLVGHVFQMQRREASIRRFAQETLQTKERLEREIAARRQAQGEVHTLTRQIEYILGAAGTGLDILDAEFNIRYIDPEWQKVYGDPAGRKCYEYFMDRSEVCPGCGVRRAFETGQSIVTEEILVKEGNRPVQVTTIPFQDDRGEWLVAEVNVDITERKRAEEELRTLMAQRNAAWEERARFAAMVEQSSDFIGLATLEGKVLYINPAGRRLVGLDQDADVSATCVLDYMTTEDQKTYGGLLSLLLQQGSWQGESRLQHFKTGSVYPVDTNAFLINWAGDSEPPLIAAIHRDITARKQAEEELRRGYEAQAILNRLLAISLGDVPLTAMLEQFLDEITRVPLFRMEARGAVLLVEEDDRVLVLKAQRNMSPCVQAACSRIPFGKCLCGRAASSGKVVFSGHIDESHEFRYEGMEPHGHYCVPILSAGKKVLGVLNLYVAEGHPWAQNEEDFLHAVAGILAGLIERKRAVESLQASKKELEQANRRLQANQNQLIQSEKMASIGQLAAGVAHEINNPVGFVMSNLGTLAGYIRTFKDLFGLYGELTAAVLGTQPERQQAVLEEIHRLSEEEDLNYILSDVDQLLAESSDGTNRVRDIVQNLKSFARLDEAQVKEADINEGIEATLKIVWNELKYKCTVQKKLGSVPLIRCYPGQLNQVFMNLLVNAAQAIPEKGDISIETGTDNGHLYIRVSDTGCGIPPEIMSRIFDPFYTTKPVGKGTGLGLAIAHGIVKKHNGAIDVDSEVGKGTTFTIRLPVEGVKDE